MGSRSTAHGSRFFAVSAVLIAVLVLLSFPLTYFIPVLHGTRFTLLRHFHGLAFFLWIGLYLVQTELVSRGNIRLHKELGIAGVALAGAMVPLGLWQTVTSAGERAAKGNTTPFEFSLYNLVDITVFAIAFGWAIHESTRRIEWHRRLMFVTALNLFGPAFSRLVFLTPLTYPWFDMAPNLIADSLLIALALYDRAKSGQIHPVTLGAMAVMVPFHALEPLIARSAWWNGIAPALFGFG